MVVEEPTRPETARKQDPLAAYRPTLRFDAGDLPAREGESSDRAIFDDDRALADSRCRDSARRKRRLSPPVGGCVDASRPLPATAWHEPINFRGGYQPGIQRKSVHAF